MKKPKKEKINIEKYSHYFESYTPYTPQDLREIASSMESCGVISVEFCLDGYDGHFKCLEKKLETDRELERRYKKELASYNKYLKSEDNRKKKLIIEAKKLGLKLIEE